MTGQDVGLIGKFKVERLVSSSRGIDHSECRYFVLDPQHDPIARRALWQYAAEAYEEGYDLLSADLVVWLREIDQQ